MAKQSINCCMVELKLRRTSLRLDFSFFAVVAIYLLLDKSGFGLAALAACAMHETAHLIAMALLGVPVEQVTLYGAGIRITSRLDKVKPLYKVIILSVGCVTNFVAAIVFWNVREYAAFVVNLYTGIFNLLPIGELDGAKLLETAVIRCCRAENVDKIMRISAIATSVICLISVIAIGGNVSFSLLTTGLYIIVISSRRL